MKCLRYLHDQYRYCRTLKGKTFYTTKVNHFSFVNKHSSTSSTFVEQCRETLRTIGGSEGSIELHMEPSKNLLPLMTDFSRVAVIEMRNPKVRNALSGKMMAELADIVTKLETEEYQSKLNLLIVKGAGPWFCSGVDLRFAKANLNHPLLAQEGARAKSMLMVDTLTRLQNLPLISIAWIEGTAMGGGAELATACDFRIIDEEAFIQFVQMKMGVTPGWGGGQRLTDIVGKREALRLLCTAEKLSPTRAIELGLADVISQHRNTEEPLNFISTIQQQPTEVLQATKRVILNASSSSNPLLNSQQATETDIFTTLWGRGSNLEVLQRIYGTKRTEN